MARRRLAPLDDVELLEAPGGPTHQPVYLQQRAGSDRRNTSHRSSERRPRRLTSNLSSEHARSGDRRRPTVPGWGWPRCEASRRCRAMDVILEWSTVRIGALQSRWPLDLSLQDPLPASPKAASVAQHAVRSCADRVSPRTLETCSQEMRMFRDEECLDELVTSLESVISRLHDRFADTRGVDAQWRWAKIWERCAASGWPSGSSRASSMASANHPTSRSSACSRWSALAWQKTLRSTSTQRTSTRERPARRSRPQTLSWSAGRMELARRESSQLDPGLGGVGLAHEGGVLEPAIGPDDVEVPGECVDGGVSLGP